MMETSFRKTITHRVEDGAGREEDEVSKWVGLSRQMVVNGEVDVVGVIVDGKDGVGEEVEECMIHSQVGSKWPHR